MPDAVLPPIEIATGRVRAFVRRLQATRSSWNALPIVKYILLIPFDFAIYSRKEKGSREAPFLRPLRLR